jgi:hypothetical protein
VLADDAKVAADMQLAETRRSKRQHGSLGDDKETKKKLRGGRTRSSGGSTSSDGGSSSSDGVRSQRKVDTSTSSGEAKSKGDAEVKRALVVIDKARARLASDVKAFETMKAAARATTAANAAAARDLRARMEADAAAARETRERLEAELKAAAAQTAAARAAAAAAQAAAPASAAVVAPRAGGGDVVGGGGGGRRGRRIDDDYYDRAGDSDEDARAGDRRRHRGGGVARGHEREDDPAPRRGARGDGGGGGYDEAPRPRAGVVWRAPDIDANIRAALSDTYSRHENERRDASARQQDLLEIFTMQAQQARQDQQERLLMFARKR